MSFFTKINTDTNKDEQSGSKAQNFFSLSLPQNKEIGKTVQFISSVIKYLKYK